jgi:signal peptidase I
MGTVLLLGWQLQVIATGSMAPRIPEGSLAVVEPLDPADVRAGMTIVFDDPSGGGRLVAHRAVKRLPGDPPAWQTKGDANAVADPYPVHASAVRGRVRWTIPRLGTVASALHGPATVVVLVGLPLAVLAATEVMRLRRRRRGADGAGPVRVYAVRDLSAPPGDPPGPYVDVFLRPEDAQRFVASRRRDEPALAENLRIVEHELERGE